MRTDPTSRYTWIRQIPLTATLAVLFLVVFPGAVTGTRPQTPEDTLGRIAPPDTTPQGLRRMTVDDYALWRSIGETALSPDGRWVTYAYSQWEVDDSLFIAPVDGGDPHMVLRGSDPEFSADSRWVAYFINPEEDEDRGSGGSSGSPSSGSRNDENDDEEERALEVRDLETGESRRWEKVDAFAFADEAGVLVVKKAASDSDAEHEGTDLIVRHLSSGEEELFSYVDEWGLDEKGTRLAYTLDTPDGESNGVHVLDLATRIRRVLDQEREAVYARLTWGEEKDRPAADALAVLKGTEDEELVETENALLLWPALSESDEEVVLDPRPAPSERTPDPFPEDWVLSEKGSLRWSPDATRIFVATQPQLPAPGTLCKPPKKGETPGDEEETPGDEEESSGDEEESPGEEEETPEAEEGKEGKDQQTPDSTDAGGPTIVRMASRYAPDGRPLGPEEVLNGTCPEFMADVDIWHVKDERLQSVQMVRARRDRNRTYTAVVHIDEGATGDSPDRDPALAGADGYGSPNAGGDRARFVQLADTTMERVQISLNGRYAMGRDHNPYVSDWKPNYADYYLVDLETGDRTPVLERQLRTLGFSPDGRHFLYWKDRHVWSYDADAGEHRNLTDGLPVTFENEQYDRMGEKPPHGVAGWTADSTGVILEHRYDLWHLPLNGGTATDLTRGTGADREIRFRIVDLEPEEELVDLSEPLTLSAFGQWTKQAGFYRLEDGDLRELVMADARFGRPTKADSTDLVLFTREDFETFPDYHVAGLDFQEPQQVTDANPQQAEFNWGRRILFDYETEDGIRLQGTLGIPYDYVEGEKRPMIISFYQKLSQNLHDYPMPIFRDTPMFAEYVSAGYLVMNPDIHFRLGATHQQMLECINLAIDRVVEMGYVDPDRIGLHGHSFSGQGAAYIATHSDRFAAIVAGAAASNLVSDFNQLWKSSGTNQHGYDTYGQGRFGTSPYDDFELFVDQSATHNAGDMNTPLLILHGTADGSVEWLQAVELYNGLRWFGKNVILMSYPGEPHHLRVWENQKDFQIRMRQFYDHHLWDKPAPRWMETGRSFLEKERDRAMVREAGKKNEKE